MTEPPPLTPDEAVLTLTRFADQLEQFAAGGRPTTQPTARPFRELAGKRAAALRWILSLTGYPVEEHTPQ